MYKILAVQDLVQKLRGIFNQELVTTNREKWHAALFVRSCLKS